VPATVARASGCEIDELAALTARLQALRQRLSAASPRVA
jgi:hypothetical protein